MAGSDHGFVWVDAYLACGCATADDTPFSIFQHGRDLERFTTGQMKYYDANNIIKPVEKLDTRNGVQ